MDYNEFIQNKKHSIGNFGFEANYIPAEIELYEAVPGKESGFFWCRDVGLPGEDGDCGKLCDGYAPKNGKTGMCRHRSNKFYLIGKKVVIKINQNK